MSSIVLIRDESEPIVELSGGLKTTLSEQVFLALAADKQWRDVPVIEQSGTFQPVADRILFYLILSADASEMRRQILSHLVVWSPMFVIRNCVSSRLLEMARLLEAGIEDYIVVDEDMVPLIPKIRAYLRRQNNEILNYKVYTGDLTVDPEAYEVYLEGKRVSLTVTELKLFFLLSKNEGAFLSTDEIMEALWPNQFYVKDVVKVHIRHLRQKLRDDARQPRFIRSIPGMGYIFSPSARKVAVA